MSRFLPESKPNSFFRKCGNLVPAGPPARKKAKRKMHIHKVLAAVGVTPLALLLTLSTSAWSATVPPRPAPPKPTKPAPPKPPKPPTRPGGGSEVTPTSYVGTWTGTATEGFVGPNNNSTSSGTLTITITPGGTVSGTGALGGTISGQIDSAGNISYQVVTTIGSQTTTGSVGGTLLLVPGGLAGQVQGTFTNPNAPGAQNILSTYLQLTPVK